MGENKLTVIHNNLQELLKTKASAMPKNFNETRFLQNAMVVLQDTKDIAKMQPMSVARTMLKGAFLGLDFFNKECYAIPYGKNIGTEKDPKWIKELTFQTDYKGEIKLAKKYSLKKIADIYAKLVRGGDVFTEYVSKGKQYIDFSPKSFNNGDIIGVFAVCLYEDGSMLYETMSAEEVDHIRITYSKMPNGKMWKDSKGEATKKTCLRRLCKPIELEFDNIEQAQAYDDGGDAKFVEEAEYESIPMPTAKEEPKPEKGEDISLRPKPKPETKESSALDQWVKEGLSDKNIATKFKFLSQVRVEVTDDLALKHEIKNDGDLAAYFGFKALTPSEISKTDYDKIMDFLDKVKKGEI